MKRARRSVSLRALPVELKGPAGLYLFCGPTWLGQREITAAEQAADCMRKGVAAIALPTGIDPAQVTWPAVEHVAVFSHDGLDDAGLHALADALIQSGVSRVTVAGSEARKR